MISPTPPANRCKVALCIPSGRTWEARTATAVAGLTAFSAISNIALALLNLEGSMISRQRNDLVDQALKLGADYVFWIDSDLTFPPDALLRLLAHDKDIVGATYNKRVAPYETLGKLKGPEGVDPATLIAKGGLVEATLLPGGMMLVKTDVYRKMGWPFYYESIWRTGDALEAFKGLLRDQFHLAMPEPIVQSIDDTELGRFLSKCDRSTEGNITSEDLAFCQKAGRVGYALWCDLDLTFELVHLGTNEVTCLRPDVEAQQAA